MIQYAVQYIPTYCEFKVNITFGEKVKIYCFPITYEQIQKAKQQKDPPRQKKKI